MSTFIFISFVCPTALLLICGCIHFINHLEINCQRTKKSHIYITNTKTPNNSRRNSRNNNSNIELQTSTRTHHFVNRSKLHIPHASHISEMSSFSTSFKQPFPKQIKHCIKKLNCVHSKDASWNFFPILFLFYILFLLILTLIIVLKYHNSTYKIINNSCSNNLLPIGQTVTDWIIIYCVIILNLWESLINFYRYWTTKECSMLRVGDTKTLYLYYFIYSISYLILCIFQFHYIYWIFPIIILSHFTMNLFCVLQFTRILIIQYNAFSNPDRKALSIVNDDMLSSVKIMCFISFISFILNTILLSLMVGCYNINLVTYLPLIYSISSFTFSFNFVRNRVFLTHFFIKIKQIPMKLKNKKDNANNSNFQLDSDVIISPSCLSIDDEMEIQTPQKQDRLNRLTLDHMTIISAPSTSFNDENMLDNNDKIETNIIVKTELEHNENVSVSSKTAAINKLLISVPPIPQQQSIAVTVTPNTEWKRTYPLTPLLNSTQNKQKFIDKYRNKSRSEPSSPLIHNNINNNNNPFQFSKAKTPQMKSRFSQSPVLNWIKQLGKTKSVVDENNNKISNKSKHKRGTKSEGLPQLSQCITHSTSLEEQNENNIIENTLLNVFGANVAVSPKRSSKSKKALDILGIDANKDEIETDNIIAMDSDENNQDEFIYFDDELNTDKLETVDDDFTLNIGIGNESQSSIHSNEIQNKKQLESYEKWNAFDEIFPSNELKLVSTMSEQNQQINSTMKSKRNSKTSTRRSSLLNPTDILKAVQLEINIDDIKEEDEELEMDECEYEFKRNIQNNNNKSGDLGIKRKSIKDNGEIVAMLRLMVQHGFYSKKTLNSVEQFRKYNSAK